MVCRREGLSRRDKRDLLARQQAQSSSATILHSRCRFWSACNMTDSSPTAANDCLQEVPFTGKVDGSHTSIRVSTRAPKSFYHLPDWTLQLGKNKNWRRPITFHLTAFASLQILLNPQRDGPSVTIRVTVLLNYLEKPTCITSHMCLLPPSCGRRANTASGRSSEISLLASIHGVYFFTKYL